jgi:Holliday junction resolvase-like predicted endonuclease
MSFYLGNRGESLTAQLFEAHGYSTEKVSTEDRDFYDLIIQKGNVKKTVEVKFDVKSRFTGNLAIEFYNSKSCKDSGIAITKANFWVYVVPEKFMAQDIKDDLWIATPSDIFSFVSSVTGKIINHAGDDNACLMLYKKELLLGPVFKCISYLKTEEIDRLIAGTKDE